MERRVIVTGATGLIGSTLCQRLREQGYAPVVFSRDPARARTQLPGLADYVTWEPAEEGAWASAVDGAYAVVSLAGAPVFGRRWTPAYKREIRDTRTVGTRGLVRAMAKARVKPQVFVSASAIGVYGFRDDTALDETDAPGTDFLAQVCAAWEAEARAAEALGVRTSLQRISIVLAKDDGPLHYMALPTRLGLGGYILPGDQWVSWVHIEDAVGALLLALEDERVRGPVNVVAPDARRHRDFMRALGRCLRRPVWAPVPGLALRLALGEFAQTLTTGQRVVPARLETWGFRFRYPTLEPALRDLLG
ncbi:MAG: TIGR01777 family oxidoreductase [Anaerolineae bacterium]|nr:TIGR01777 family oxidoreductase [Anaerolineae bacterium]